MSSRDYIKHVVLANTSINGQKIGDEVFDPTTNKLYKALVVDGTTVTNAEVLLNGPALANTNISVGKISLATYQSANSTNTGTLVVGGGVGVSDSVYVGNRIGFANTNNISVMYQVYNPATSSFDIVSG
jgi:hypothetical protein